jgi:predicted nucleic acid-binding protein
VDKVKVYLDNCCFNRPFDIQNQVRVKLETIAKLHIQNEVKKGIYCLVWSYMNDYENSFNPYEDKKFSIQKWENIAKIKCAYSKNILEYAKQLKQSGLKEKDALHIACAVKSKCSFFITTDDKLYDKCIAEIKIVNPIDFIVEMGV